MQQQAKKLSAAFSNRSILDSNLARAQDEAFNSHMARYSRLDAAVLNAGIGERGDFFNAKNAGWQRTLDVDLTAVLHGIR